MVDSEPQGGETPPPAHVAAPDSFTLFLAALPTRFTKDELAGSMRVTNRGLFVDQRFADRFVQGYEQWLQEFTGSGGHRSQDKGWRRLFGGDHPTPHYILEGQHCAVGYVVEAHIDAPQKLGVPLYRGNPLDATGYLHQKDPIFSTLRGVEVQTGPRGLEVRVPLRSGGATIWTLRGLTALRDLVTRSRWLKKIGRSSGSTLRDCVALLERVMRSARFVGQKEVVLVPGRLKGDKTLRLIRSGTLMVVTTADGSVESCYELVGRNLRDFLLAEVGATLQRKPVRKLRDARLIAGRGGVLAELFTASQRYPLDVGALAEFVRLYRHVDPPVRFAARLYTAADAVEAFAQLYKDALLCAKKGGDASFNHRERGNVLFELGRGNAVFRFRVRRLSRLAAPKRPK